eukprot:CAMPEP_0170500448 /NCGR_PEP_ID=MMETSP0208-20121228/34881_1 /TAXON_ID=197538 /ORGANISM="Strombidium inclinatum, Strain S3" /LENGTH=87 /DNA_ID=CAMNT_0010778495 /DNA_START=279 /DNA_END=542 /DNA_ORIENTATION=-
MEQAQAHIHKINETLGNNVDTPMQKGDSETYLNNPSFSQYAGDVNFFPSAARLSESHIGEEESFVAHEISSSQRKPTQGEIIEMISR